MNISAIVLCGGRSSRMGRNKAILPFKGETSTDRVVRLVREVTTDIVLVGRRDPGVLTDCPVIGDPGEGPLVALAIGLGATSALRTLVVACDMPLVRPALLAHLVERIGEHDACVPRTAGTAVPTCAVYARGATEVARSLVAAGDRSLRALLDRVSVQWVEEPELREVDPDLRSFIDCDTPEDYARALRIAGLGR